MLKSFITSVTLDILASLLQQFSNWLCELGEVQNEPSIKVSQPKETSHPDGARPLYNEIWSAKVPPKVRIFAWKLSHEGLATDSNWK
jgi:hypothetical protein